MSLHSSRRARPRKLQPKQIIQLFREDQVDVSVELQEETEEKDFGVEKSESSEYHLQQAIKASQAAVAEASKLKDAYIPTPPIIASNVNYDALYHKGYRQPATYIRSSATVEDCAGAPYCMDEEDEVALKQINAQLPDGVKECSEDHFEEVFSFFEETAQNKQPFAAVDSPPVLPLEELEEQYDSTVPAQVRTYAKFIYEHWKVRRETTQNRVISPQLKGETGADTDDADPYVCFRRREARQVRKTRNRDAHSAEKLRTLRFQLEAAREILQQVKRREMVRKAMLETDRDLFKQRAEVKETKRKLGIKGDEEDLVNQKKPRKETHLSPAQAALAQQLRMPLGRGGPQDELRLLEDVQANRQRDIEKEININIEKHINWNKGYVDRTRAPLTPSTSPQKGSFDPSTDFRQAMPVTEYLPTPPASVSDEGGDAEAVDVLPDADGNVIPNPEVEAEISTSISISKPPSPTPIPSVSVSIRYQSPGPHAPSFRTRIGRGGRMLVDRRNLPFRPQFPETRPFERSDRWKFDSDEDIGFGSDDENNFHDDFDSGMNERAFLYGKAQSQQQQQQYTPARMAQLVAAGVGGDQRSPPQPQQASPTQQLAGA